MKRILFAGDFKAYQKFFEALLDAGHQVSIVADSRFLSDTPSDLMVIRINTVEDTTLLSHQTCPWLAWCSANLPELQTAAYQAGALSVIMEGTPAEVFLQILLRTLDRFADKRERVIEPAVQRRYQKGDVILLENDSVLEIQQGIVAQTMVYEDGSGVLLALCGPQQMIVPHPADTCYIQLVSHTDSVVIIRTWESLLRTPDFADKLRARLQQLEAWAAIQARPHLDQRVTGILSLLAEQFGVNTSQGRLVDVRITHIQLALAVGATRTTITRTLGDLRRQGVLSLVQTPDGERFCLSRWEHGDHCFHC
ncbi:MAG: Crp/Fnr family transcriptional regulator [Anaerolineae bacterium]|nr:Crp/Fnr family transcriptional regulator [Anaerolineae bacterium]